MSVHVINCGDETFVRSFSGESLSPPSDYLSALAAARRGERKIDPLAALVRHALAAESKSGPNVRRVGSRWMPPPSLSNRTEQRVPAA